ncbi:MAG: glycosyltransferase family 2 protein [Gammaproteobacteria bacterium]
MNAILTDRDTANRPVQSCLADHPAVGPENVPVSGAPESASTDARVRQSDSERRDRAGEAPLFSIIVTTYNRPARLKRALESLQKQILQDFEVIVVNDYGESVESVLREFSFDITYVCHGRNRGLSAARNTALRLARGKLIGYLDDDDVWPEHLAVHAKAHAEHTESVVYTDTRYVFSKEGGCPLRRIQCRKKPFPRTACSSRISSPSTTGHCRARCLWRWAIATRHCPRWRTGMSCCAWLSSFRSSTSANVPRKCGSTVIRRRG